MPPAKGALVRRAQTIFSEEEFAKITEYLKRKRKHMYTFLKEAALAYIREHP